MKHDYVVKRCGHLSPIATLIIGPISSSANGTGR